MEKGFKVLAINFHYVRPNDERYPRLYHRTIEQIRNQFDALARVAQHITPEQLEDALSDPIGTCVKHGFVFTFDDGLKDHIRYVSPELERRGWKAFFFVNTAPWEGELLEVHRLQLLNASVPFPKLYGLFVDLVREMDVGIDPSTIPMESVRRQYRYDEDDVARFKFAVNFELSGKTRDVIVRRLFESFMGSEKQHMDDLYLSPADCKMLTQMGHTVGCHSHQHHALSRMTPPAIAKDLANNFRSVGVAIEKRPRWISFPYGGKDAIDQQVLDACAQQGIQYGFTMNRGFIDPSATRIALNRVDTNDAVGGKSPIIHW